MDEGAAICPSCDQILDTSFLSGDEAGEEAAPEPPRPAVVRKRSAATSPNRAATGAQRSQATGGQRSARPAYDEQEEEDVRPSSFSPNDYVDDGRPSAVDNEFSQTVADIQSFLGALELGDKAALGAYCAGLAATLLPWKQTCDQFGLDSEVGIVGTIGAVSFGLALAAVVLLIVRVRNLVPSFSPAMVWTAQLGVTGANILWCLLSFKLASVAGVCLVGSEKYAPSSATYGLTLATLFALVSLGGALLGLRSKAH